MRATAYTIGYEGLGIEAFVSLLRAARIVHLIDIREVAISRKKGFSKGALSQHLQDAGVRYTHIRALGCPKPTRDRYREDGNWTRYTRAFLAYLDTQATVVLELDRTAKKERCALMCFEADYTRCHRSLVAQRLNCAVTHLAATGLVTEAAAAVA
jgi:uncharacterized protein (DUF488 family)